MLSKTTQRTLAVLAASAVSALGNGCAAPANDADSADQRVDHVSQAIISGQASGPAQDSVVVLTTFAQGQRAALCTATLVAPNLILTARHCVSNVDEQTACAQDGTPVAGSMISGNRIASSLVVFVGKNGVAPDSTVEANAAAHGAQVIVDASTTVCNHDIAFVQLDQNVDAPTSPMRLGAPSMTETISAVGWGVDASGTLPSQREVRDGLSLIGIGPAPFPNNPSWGYGDSEFMIGESTCFGDSGSPAFAASGAIVGIAARSGNGSAPTDNMATTCMGSNAHSIYTHLDKFTKVINVAFQVAGQPQWLEGQPNPWGQVTPASTDPTSPGSAPTGASSSGSAANPANPVANKDSANANVLGDNPEASGSKVNESKPEAGGCSSTNGKSNGFGAVLLGLALVAATRRRRSR